MPTFKELAALTEPPLLVELYAIKDTAGAAVFLTSGRDAAVFNGMTFQPAPITRTAIKTDDAMTTHSCQITVPLNPILGNYITQAHVRAEISIWMMFQGYPESAVALLHGIIPGGVNMDIDKKTVTALCVSPNASLLENNVPRVRYMGYCQNTIYDSNCGVNKLQYRTPATLTAVNGTILRSPAFAATGWRYACGMVQYGPELRDIIYHNGEEIHISMAFTAALEVGGHVEAWPGCGGVYCYSGGHPNYTPSIPSHNPVAWGL